jgi:hypothetical protein
VVELGGGRAGKKFVTVRDCSSLGECKLKRIAQKHLVRIKRVEARTAVTYSGDTQFESRSSRRYSVCVFGSLFHSSLERISILILKSEEKRPCYIFVGTKVHTVPFILSPKPCKFNA